MLVPRLIKKANIQQLSNRHIQVIIWTGSDFSMATYRVEQNKPHYFKFAENKDKETKFNNESNMMDGRSSFPFPFLLYTSSPLTPLEFCGLG